MVNRSITIWLIMTLLIVLTGPAGVQAGAALPALTTLEPGAFRSIQQNLQINLVYLGFEPSQVDTTSVRAGLPDTYRVINRYPDFYGNRQFLGNDFTFDYNQIFADKATEDAFFAMLATDNGELNYEDAASIYQLLYSGLVPSSSSNQQSGRLDITRSRYIDAVMVEEWLETNLASSTGDYTVFFINWYGRPDFAHHVYTNYDFVDPDTGVNFGRSYEETKMIAWGGTTGRSWFYDFSAGPEYNTSNWLVDDPPGRFVPPIWEYGYLPGFPVNSLTDDITRLARYVAIDLLFTPSPLYKPLLSPPALPQTIDFDVNLFTDDGAVTADSLVSQTLLIGQYDDFMPYKDFSVDLDTYALDGRAEQIFECFAADAGSCYGGRLFNIAFGDLFLYTSDHILTFLDGDADYEIPMVVYHTNLDRMGAWIGLLGFADDNWRDGTQSYIFNFSSPELLASGYGLTWTLMHESGHHVGLSHPHDGFDYEDNIDFGPEGEFYFVWAGDESDSLMHYLHITNEFGVFNRDSMYRYETAGYINTANTLLGDIATSPRAGQVSALIQAADTSAAGALDAYAEMDYASAVVLAQAAYNNVLAAAAAINIPVEPHAWQADVKSRGYKYNVDRIRYPDQ